MRGDVLRRRAGRRRRPVLEGRPEVDESLLIGESEALPQAAGDDLLSGSFMAGGEGLQEARDVGAASYAGRLTAEARRVSTDRTPLQRRIDFLVPLVMLLVLLKSVTILAQAALEGFTLVRTVQTTAVLSGLVPYGLFFPVAVAYTVGAARSAGRGALVQQVNAVESVSDVDVVCTDKAGTLTTGQLSLAEVRPVGPLPAADVERLLVTAAGGVAVYTRHDTDLPQGFTDDAVPSFVVEDFESYTGVSSDDVGSAEAAATIGAQTALSTFVSYAAFLLILFLEPPNRWFAARTRPDGDRRPALLVAVLVVVFSAGLFWPAFPATSGSPRRPTRCSRRCCRRWCRGSRC